MFDHMDAMQLSQCCDREDAFEYACAKAMQKLHSSNVELRTVLRALLDNSDGVLVRHAALTILKRTEGETK